VFARQKYAHSMGMAYRELSALRGDILKQGSCSASRCGPDLVNTACRKEIRCRMHVTRNFYRQKP